MLTQTVHGQVEVVKPWFVLEFRNGFRNAVHQFDSEPQAKAFAASRREDAKAYRATSFSYQIQKGVSDEVPAGV